MTNYLEPKLNEGDLVRHTDPVWPWEVNNIGLVIKVRGTWQIEAKVLWVDKVNNKMVRDWFDQKFLDIVRKNEDS